MPTVGRIDGRRASRWADENFAMKGTGITGKQKGVGIGTG